MSAEPLDESDTLVSDRTVAPVGGGAPQAEQLSRGAVVGRYTILEPLGAGAMGEVYSAWDPELDRKVALKFLRHAASPHEESSGRQRLLREARAAAQLRHPHVVTVYDIVQDRERLFLSLELVEGGTLGEWLRRAPRSWREVVAVFTDAGRGLAAAHAAGLVHRDFKPDNVLVDRTGRALVGDFGLARPVGEASPAADVPPAPRSAAPAAAPAAVTLPALPALPSPLHTPLTEAGALVGTPQYMSPEQFDGRDADARSDQFAFCVALFEALYGARPFGSGNVAELGRRVLEGRLAVPARKGALPAHLWRALERGLSVEPSARFPTMDALLQALGADPRARLRRAAAVAAGALAVAAAAGWLGTAHWREARACAASGEQARVALRERSGAPLARAFLAPGGKGGTGATGATGGGEAHAAVARLFGAYADGLAQVQREVCEATHVRREGSPGLLDARMRCLEERRTEAGALLSVLERGGGVDLAGAPAAVAALEPPARCARIAAASEVAPPPAAVAVRVDQVRARLAEARALDDLGQLSAGRALAAEVQREAAATGYGPLEAEALVLLGKFEGNEQHEEQARAHLHRAVELALAARADETAAAALIRLAMVAGEGDERHAEALRWLGQARALTERLSRPDWLLLELAAARGAALSAAGDAKGALAELDAALALCARTYGEADLKCASIRHTAVPAHLRAGQPDAALAALDRVEAQYRAAMGGEAPVLAGLAELRGTALYFAQRPDDAAEALARSIALYDRFYGEDNLQGTAALNNAAVVLRSQGRHREALGYFERAYRVAARHRAPDHADVASTSANLVRALSLAGRQAEAAALQESVLAAQVARYGAGDRTVALSRLHLAELQARQGRTAQALAELQRVGAVLAGLTPPAPADERALVHAAAAEAHALAGRRGEAAAALGQAVAVLAAESSSHPDLADMRLRHGEALLEAGRPADAVAPLTASLAALGTSNAARLGRAHFALARALAGAGEEPQRARTLAEEAARHWARSRADAAPERLAEVRRWLAEHGAVALERP
jgi:tetratricopeptide (TPR) repeat protein